MTPSLFPKDFIDLINSISGVKFVQAWEGRTSEILSGQETHVSIHYIGLATLIINKEAAGRPKDMEDLKYLREAAKKQAADS